MEATSTGRAKYVVHLDKVQKKRRGKPKATLLNVIRNSGGGKDAFRELKWVILNFPLLLIKSFQV
jgi:hypothetical protein